jgi:flagellar assembly protein FliH
MSPTELESRIAAQAAQRSSQQFYEQAISGIAEALESLDQARRDLLYQAEPRLIELAVLIARRVIATELRANSDIVADLVREGIDALAVRDKVRVSLGPGFTLAATLITEQLVARGIELELQVVPGMPEYGCVVETDIGSVDEGIESRLDRLLASIQQESEG